MILATHVKVSDRISIPSYIMTAAKALMFRKYGRGEGKNPAMASI